MSGIHLSAAARSEDTTLNIDGDYTGLPEESNHQHVLRIGFGDRSEFVTYDRRVGSVLVDVRRGLVPQPQNAGEGIVPEWDDRQLAFSVGMVEALAEAYGAEDPQAVAVESLRRFGARELGGDLVADLVEFVRESAR